MINMTYDEEKALYTIEKDDRLETIVLHDNKIRLEATDPYGFVHVSFEKGRMPKQLQGSFTGFEEAYKTLLPYLRSGYKNGVEHRSANKKKRQAELFEEE